MDSPSKKRKKNGFPSSSQSLQSLDSFFSKQSQKIKEIKSSPPPPQDVQESDEQLAQRLQLEFNREYDESMKSQSPLPKPNHPPSLSLQVPSPPIPTTALTTSTLISPVQSLALQSTSSSSQDTYTSTIPLSDPPVSFNPDTHVPELLAVWSSSNQSPTYALLTHTFTILSATASRILITNTLTNALRILICTDPSSLLPAVWLCTNAIAPPYAALELGLGGSAISQALVRTSGLDARALKTFYSKMGDPGDVAFEAKRKGGSMTLRKPTPLTVVGVYESLVEIAKATGTGSREVKQRIVERLLGDARSPEESRYLVRTLVSNLRIGAVKATMLTALARAFVMTSPSEGSTFETLDPQDLAKMSKDVLTEIYSRSEEAVKQCFAQHPSYTTLVSALLTVGVLQPDQLVSLCGLTLHVPLRPMLGSITRDLSDMLSKVQGREWTAEYKYDGQRAQVHYDGSKVSIFSRHLEDMSGKYPDLKAIMPQICGKAVHDFILEGEVVAVDANGQVKPFQTLAGRARGQTDLEDVKVQVCLFAFDLMYLNGESLLSKTLRERRSLLTTKLNEIPTKFNWVQSMDGTDADADAVHKFFKSAVAQKCEGIMVKLLDNPDSRTNGEEKNTATNKFPSRKGNSNKPNANLDTSKPASGRRKQLLATYEPDKRLDSWLKVKKDYHASAETLDLVPIAGWHGQGRKAEWWSPILLAAYSPITGHLVAVTKCMSGFTDVFYTALRKKYAPDGDYVVHEQPAWVEYHGGHPEVWFRPGEVWEIAFADITLSPTYTAAIDQVGGERGLSLRFPRFLRKREDKGIEEASTEEFLADLYYKQSERAPAEAMVVEEKEDKRKRKEEDLIHNEEVEDEENAA